MIITNPNDMTIEELNLVCAICKVDAVINDGILHFAKEVQSVEQNQN